MPAVPNCMHRNKTDKYKDPKPICYKPRHDVLPFLKLGLSALFQFFFTNSKNEFSFLVVLWLQTFERSGRVLPGFHEQRLQIYQPGVGFHIQ